ncbi:MAG: hypothetical protein JXR36_00675 [Bacteroidales bacterium]|nr:hypothetical protein [Bacteroidales bacterium]
MNKCKIILLLLLINSSYLSEAQCLSSVNPVGGTNNLLVLEKKSFWIISFYKYGQGTQYYEGNSVSNFNLINKAFYNYLSMSVGYGLTWKTSLELETGYFINKTQVYNLEPNYRLTGNGLSNFVLLLKQSLYTDPFNRIYITGAAGAKIPSSQSLQWDNNVKLPVEVQPTIGAFGAVFTSSFVKENSGTSMRYFITNRTEINGSNKEDYKLGTSVYTSLYVSRHLRVPWLKDKWTAIFQLRNEIRSIDKINGVKKESSGSTLFFVVPQLNYVLKDNWYISAMVDIPVYQYFNGTQLGADSGFTFIVSRTLTL